MNSLRYSFRTLRRSPWYAATAISLLGIGIALPTVVFAIVDGVLFKPTPYPRPQELYLVRADRTTAPAVEPPPVSFIEIETWRAAATEARLTAVSSAPYRFKRTDGREYWAADVDEHFFDVVGIRPLLGGFSREDFDWYQPDQGRGVRPVLVSYRYWQSELGGRLETIGVVGDAWRRESILWGQRVVGVLPPDFVFPLDSGKPQPEIVSPIARGFRSSARVEYQALVRAPAAVAELGVRLAAATRRASLGAPPDGHQRDAPFDTVRLLPLADELGRHERPAFALVFAGSALLLLLACVNVAGLASARNIERRRSLAVCRALGASGVWLVRGLLCEIGVVALAASGVAVVLAAPMLTWTIELLPPTVTLLKTPAIDGRVLVATIVFALGAVGLVAIWPARVATRLSGSASLGAISSTATRATRRSSSILVAAQVALAFILLTAGALTITSFAAAWRTNSGYSRERMILVEAYIRNYASSADATLQLEQLRDLLSRLPGVQRVATSSIQPFFDSSTQRAFTGLVPRGWKGASPLVSMRKVSPEFFEVMGIGLVDGRWPARGEWEIEQPVAIVSETAARTLWADRPAVGQVLVAGGRQAETPRTVIAVVADARYTALDREPLGDIYTPDRFEIGRTGVFFHIRTADRAAAAVPLVAQALRERNVFANQVATHEDALFASVRHRALPAWLFGWLGAAAAVLSGVGILGLLMMSAAQRTREMGVRIALGATTARVIGLLMREQLLPVGTGLLAGVGISLPLARLAGSQLYHVSAYDPAVWSAVALALVGMAFIGTLVPSLRAARVNPVDALRSE